MTINNLGISYSPFRAQITSRELSCVFIDAFKTPLLMMTPIKNAQQLDSYLTLKKNLNGC